MIRDLKGVMEREKAPIGVFLTLAAPTKPMIAEAASAGFYELEGRKYPRLQIITVADALHGAKPAIPLVDTGAAFKKAAKEAPSRGSLHFKTPSRLTASSRERLSGGNLPTLHQGAHRMPPH